MTTPPHEKPATRAVRAGIATDEHHRAVVPPVHLSSTFAFDGFGRKRRYDYTRSGNPTRDHLGDAMAELEVGCGAEVTRSGMSAVALALQLAPPRGKVLAAHDCYGGTYRLLRALATRGQIELELADLTAGDAASRVLASNPDLLWVETPSNPLLRITDLRAVADAGRRAGAVVVADNTFLSPALQRPLTLGADVVVHSTTKYLNGHSDVVGGAVIARDPAHLEALAWWGNCLGLTGSPFDSFLTLRGVRTLFARIRVHEENAQLIARALEAHPAVLAVHYPGLESHPGHALAAGQQDGFGGMVSFVVRGGEPAVEELTAALRCFTLAESLGGVESLIAHPATMTHASMDADARRVAGIGDGLLRLSVGIESGEELVGDLVGALDAVADGTFTAELTAASCQSSVLVAD
jgi:cystathionine gamma-synthase